jgi:hypothetical protein
VIEPTSLDALSLRPVQASSLWLIADDCNDLSDPGFSLR